MESETNKPTKGTWDRLGNDSPRMDKVTFVLNTPVTLTFAGEPIERDGEGDAVYYEFAVWDNEVPKIIQTSAWTLLAELKKLSPLDGKKITITKLSEKGRQYFTVAESESPANKPAVTG